MSFGSIKFTREFIHFHNPYDNMLSVFGGVKTKEEIAELEEEGYKRATDEEVCKRLGLDINSMEK